MQEIIAQPFLFRELIMNPLRGLIIGLRPIMMQSIIMLCIMNPLWGLIIGSQRELIMSTRDPDGPTKYLIKGESFEVYACGLSEYEFSKPVINKRRILEESRALRCLNDIEWCVLEVDIYLCTTGMVNTEDIRLLTEED